MRINQGRVLNMKTHLSLQINNKNSKSASNYSVWIRRVRRHGASRLIKVSVQPQSLEKVSYNNQVLLLSENDAQKFVDIMQNPPKPSSALIALLKGGSVNS
jgi:Protein of unknown function (DUF1778)